MVIRRGSCDFTLFSVHPGAHSFHGVGVEPDNTRRLEYRIEKNNSTALMRAEADGAIWGWRYGLEQSPSFIDESPDIWVVRNTSTGAVLYTHESETRIGEVEASPICAQQVGRNDAIQSIIPAGSETKRIIIPMDTVITDLETEIETAALPSWITGTSWGWAADNETLLSFLFQEEQRLRGLPSKVNIDAVYSTEMPVERSLLYSLLWLRCASSILYNHADRETCIPLVKSRFIIDSDGLVTIS